MIEVEITCGLQEKNTTHVRDTFAFILRVEDIFGFLENFYFSNFLLFFDILFFSTIETLISDN